MKIVSFTICLLLASPFAVAIDNYKCTVGSVYQLSDKGLLIPNKIHMAPNTGDVFMVNGRSGEITGPNISNTSTAGNPQILNKALHENSFKAITIHPISLTIDLLEIHTYEKAQDKKFIFKGAFGEIVTGLCSVI